MSQILFVQEEPRNASILIEILIPIGEQRVQFPDVQQLRASNNETIILKSLSLVTPKALTHGILNGLPNATVDELKKMSVVLYSMGWERAQYIPILHLNDTADSDATTATAIPFKNNAARFADWKRVSWEKCYIQFANGQPSAGATAYTVILEVQYMKFDSQGAPIEVAS